VTNLNHIVIGQPDNPPLILLHGFLGCAQDWLYVMQQLSDRYCCIAVDLPGHGESHFADYSFAAFSDVMSDFIAKYKQPILLGYSMGGRLALYLAIKAKPELKGLILGSTNPGIQNRLDRKKRYDSDLMLAKSLEQEDFNSFLVRWYNQPLFASLLHAIDLETLLQKRVNNNPYQLAQALRGMSAGRQPDLWPGIKNLSFPVLVLAGSLDEKYAQIALRLKKTGGNITVRLINAAGHNIHLEQPNSFIHEISRFMIEEC